MKDILEEILAYKRKEVEREKAELPPEQLFALVEGRWRNAHDGTARHGKVPAYMTDARKHRSMRESSGSLAFRHHRGIQTEIPFQRVD